MSLTERMTKLAKHTVAIKDAALTEHDSDYQPDPVLPRPPEEVRHYAPPFHPDRISDATKTMCEAIDRIYLNTADELDARVAEFKAKVAEIEECVRGFKLGMREAGDDLLGRIKMAMGHCEDLTAKMQESPFNRPLALNAVPETKKEEPPADDAGTS